MISRSSPDTNEVTATPLGTVTRHLFAETDQRWAKVVQQKQLEANIAMGHMQAELEQEVIQRDAVIKDLHAELAKLVAAGALFDFWQAPSSER
jgi:hypothetical protein